MTSDTIRRCNDLEEEIRALRRRVVHLERRLVALEPPSGEALLSAALDAKGVRMAHASCFALGVPCSTGCPAPVRGV
jgi:hypothetical protein